MRILQREKPREKRDDGSRRERDQGEVWPESGIKAPSWASQDAPLCFCQDEEEAEVNSQMKIDPQVPSPFRRSSEHAKPAQLLDIPCRSRSAFCRRLQNKRPKCKRPHTCLACLCLGAHSVRPRRRECSHGQRQAFLTAAGSHCSRCFFGVPQAHNKGESKGKSKGEGQKGKGGKSGTEVLVCRIGLARARVQSSQHSKVQGQGKE